MQKSSVNHSATVAHRRAQASTTLNRRYVRRPSGTMMTSQTGQTTQMKQTSRMGQMAQDTDVKISIKRSPKIKRFDTSMEQKQMQKQQTQEQQMQEQMQPAEMHPVQKTAQTRMRERQSMMQKQQMQSKMTAKELKDQAIKKALMSAATSDMKEQQTITSKKSKKKMGKMRFGFGRVMLALSCATAVVFAVAYFVNMNMPDISLRVAAMRTGIDATYPSYVPRDYNVAGITSENGKVVLDFHNNTSNENFTLEEEASSWDSNALLTNYVKDAFGNEYSIIREQGLTIYIKGSSAAWVNGGIVYKLKADDGVLTNKQIRSIAVSL